MRIRKRDLMLAVMAAVLSLAALPLEAQRIPTPPTPPDSPRPPRPPRPPHPPRWSDSGDGVAKIDTVVPFSSRGTVELTLVAGTMKLSTWDRNQVRVVASTSGEPSLELDVSDSHLSLEQVRTRRNGNDDRLGRATYDVTVPVGSRASLSAVSGDITAAGIRGRLEVDNVSGNIDVRDIGSTLDVEGVSGRITIANVGGDARVENVNGRVSITGVAGSANAETVSGALSISGVQGERVHATSVSGDIDFSGAIKPSGRYEFETHSGQTNLKLASNANAEISVETFSGSVSNGYAGAVRRRNSDTDEDSTNYDYVIGRGEGRVRVETFSGNVHISQGNQ
jgi:DUF4097 and DUF4098 domain-containing protein YvlB